MPPRTNGLWENGCQRRGVAQADRPSPRGWNPPAPAGGNPRQDLRRDVGEGLFHRSGRREMTGINRVKTWILIAALGGLFVGLGALFGGRSGALIALVFAFAFNFAMYWFSDRIAILSSRSKPVSEGEAPELYGIVRELTQAKGMPMPKIYISDMPQPNAFATGRNPEHAAVSVTRGLLQVVDERELRGVLAHEISHVANHDILISS